MSGKRLHYDEDYSTDSCTTESDCEYNPNKVLKASNSTMVRRPTRQPKSFSRNALMARENRLKKKLYMENLERELTSCRNLLKKNTAVLKEQANVIEKQEKELKYLKSVLANSSDISRLLRTINTNTGMDVTTSLNKNFTINGNQKESYKSTHPWFEPSPSYESDFSSNIPNIDIPYFSTLPDDILEQHSPSSLTDHNYTLQTEDNDDVGVCLHISKHKVALEFCVGCNENASDAWMQKEH